MTDGRNLSNQPVKMKKELLITFEKLRMINEMIIPLAVWLIILI